MQVAPLSETAVFRIAVIGMKYWASFASPSAFTPTPTKSLFPLRAATAVLASLAILLVIPSAPAQAQTPAACKVSGTVGVPFSPNLAVACANNSSITVCPLVSGTLPIAPGIGTLSGCVISGTPGEAGVFKGDIFQVGSTDYALEIDIGGSLSNPLAPWNITTVAGSGTITGPAASLSIGHPIGIASDALGNVYFASDRNQVFKVDKSGNLTTVAGNASVSYSGDGGPAIDGSFNFLWGAGNLAVDSSGNLYIGDTYNYVVRRVDASTGTITTIAGGGGGGNGGPATSAYLNYPGGVAVDRSGNVFIGEPGGGGDIVDRVDGKTGIITAAAGIRGSSGYSGDGGPATNAQLNDENPSLDVAVDTAGNLFIADNGNSVIRAVNMQASVITIAGVTIQPGDIATIAGNGRYGYSGDGGPAISAELVGGAQYFGVYVDTAGNLFINDGNDVIRAVNTQASVTTIAGVKIQPGDIATIAGNGSMGYTGDGGPATKAELGAPAAVTVDGFGNIFIADYNNERIRRVDGATGIITTFAGGLGVGDGGPATNADLWLHAPGAALSSAGIALDEQGNLFIADSENNRVRRVDRSSGVITTVAGNGGSQGNTGVGGPAVAAQLYYPGGIAVDGAGNLFIADGWIQRVDAATGTISTVAGGGTVYGSAGDGGPATNAEISPFDVAVDKSGNLYIPDSGASIRRVDASTGVITTYAGNGTMGYTGDGGSATKAELFSPNGVAVDGAGNLFIADTDNGLVRRVDGKTGIITTVAGGGSGDDGGPATSAMLIRPAGVAVSAAGNLFIADLWWGKVFRVDHITGIINTVAGNGTWGFSGDGASALEAELDYPGRVAVNGSDVYIGDIDNNRIRHIVLPAFVSLTTSSLTFGSQQLNTASSAQTVTLTNSGDARLTISSIAPSSDFSESDNCGTGVAVNASCTITVTFKPTVSGPRSGAIILTDSAGDSPEVISLSGTATGLVLLPSSVTVTPSSSSITTVQALSVTVAVSGGSSNPMPTGSVILTSGNYYASPSTALSNGSAIFNIPAGTLAVGGYTFTASYTPDSSSSSIYNNATGTSSVVMVSQAPTITFTVPNHIYGDAPFTVSATSNSSGAITYSVLSGPATISGSTVTLTGAGTVVLQATQVAVGNYTAKTQTATFTVAGQAPTITFTVPNHTYGDAPFTVVATSNSSGAITYSVVSGPATISGSTVTLTGAGSVVLQASQVAAGNYAAGTQTATVTVAGNAPTISFTVPNHTYGDAAFTVTATSNSSGAISYSVVSGAATISGSTVTLTGAGTVVLQASQAAAGNYTAGTQTATVTVAKESQTITFTQPTSPVTYGVSPITLSGSASSGLAIAFSVVSGPATVSGSTLTITGAGTVVVAANQAGNINYAAATQVTQSITVNPTAQTITFSAPVSPVTYGVSPITLSASASSGLAVAFNVVSGPGTISGSTLTITGAGTVVVAANQAGNTNYVAATQVTQSITVNQASQTITFTAPTSPVTYGVSPITLSATSTSGLAVTFSVVSGPGTISSSTLTITGVGAVVVAANQAGNTNYSAATQVTQNIVVNVIGLAATPTFSPVAGTFTSAQTVTISDATSGATIYYTTNGTTPTTSSTAYSGAIAVSSTETLEAIATATGYSTSAVASAAYTINIPTNPVPAIGGISPAFTNAGGAVFTLTVNGSGFIASSTAYWGTSALTTTYVSATQLTAQVPAADTAAAGTNAITVQTAAPGGGTSNAWQFEVDSPSSGSTAPTITSTTETVAAGSSANYPVTVPSSVTSVYVTCLNLPTGASCSYSSTTNTVTITTSSTTPKGTYQIIVVFTETVSGAAFLVPILLLPLGFMRRKRAARGIWLTACLGLVLLATAALSIGCGGGSSGGSGSTTPPATHQVTSSGAISLTIQ
jgi:sugar lactone lactonase YvrE